MVNKLMFSYSMTSRAMTDSHTPTMSCVYTCVYSQRGEVDDAADEHKLSTVSQQSRLRVVC